MAQGQAGSSAVSEEPAITCEEMRKTVMANATTLMDRLKSVAPQPGADAASAEACMQRLSELIDAAQDHANLTRMPTSWQAWL